MSTPLDRAVNRILLKRTVAGFQTSMLIAFGSFTVFAILDFVYFFSIIEITLGLRISTLIVVGLSGFLAKKIRLKKINILSLFTFGIMLIFICVYNIFVMKFDLMLFWSDFVAINISLFLVLLGVGFILNWPGRYTLYMNLFTMLVFFVTHYFFVKNYQGLVLSLTLLGATSCLTTIYSIRSYAYLQESYKKRYQLNQANRSLQRNLLALEKMLSIEREAKQEKKLRIELEELNSKLQSLYTAREVFFSELSHEVRTPLSIILWKLERALEQYAKQKKKQAMQFRKTQKQGKADKPAKSQHITFLKKEVQLMYNYGYRLIHKFNAILDLAKYEGTKRLYIKPHDLPELLARFVEENLPVAHLKSIKFRLEIASALQSKTKQSQVYLDQEEMLTILSNLFHNSLKHTSRRGWIQISLSESDDHYIIVFADNGEGIPTGKIKSLFEHFYQIKDQQDTTGEKLFPSSGLGLALIRKAVLAHGGDISLQSKHIEKFPDQHGTQVTLHLRKGKEHLNNIPNTQIIYSKRYKPDSPDLLEADILSEEQLRNRGAKVLLVDNDGDFLDMLERTLCEEGYVALTEESAEEGLKKAIQESPQLIITDLAMPTMDGIQFVREVKKVKHLKNTPIIMLTGKLKANELPQDVRESIACLINKPPSYKDLLKKVDLLTAM